MTRNIKLYKYLDVNGGLMMLHNSNLQFTNATRLNDPFDCHPALFDFSHAPEYPYNWPSKDYLAHHFHCFGGALKVLGFILSYLLPLIPA